MSAKSGTRRRCPQCQEVRVFPKRAQVTCSKKCSFARRNAMGNPLAGSRWKAHATLTANSQQLAYRLRRAGASEEVVKLACHARDLAYASAYASGRRKGWAEALGEKEHEPSEAQRAWSIKGGQATAAKRRAA